ncbi:MAG TPA: phage capsid protein [Puia sp.]|nr:phage capsid protein [Puia sp.]
MRQWTKALGVIFSIGLLSSPAFTAMQTLSETTGLPFFILLAVTFLLYRVIPKIRGVRTAGIQVEIWERDIIGNLFKNNDFLLQAYNADQYVLQGKVVHIPQAGGLQNVVKNRNALPAAVTQRTDVDITYALDEYTSDPFLISNAETVELSYDKRMSLMTETIQALRQTVADTILINWAPSNGFQLLRTSGGAAGKTAAAYTPGATGVRKTLSVLDVIAAQAAMDGQDIPDDDRYALLDAQMYSQLLAELSQTQYRDFASGQDLARGIIGEMYGFKFYKRSSVLIYDGNPLPKAYGAAGAATDNAASLFWQKNSLERALGEVKMFERMNDPQYYGDVYSVLLRMGGRIRRNDGKGLIAMAQQ